MTHRKIQLCQSSTKIILYIRNLIFAKVGKMSLKPINNILSVLETQSKWQEQPFLQLLKSWSEVVGATVAAHTQPLSIQRDVLRVATSSAAWAQNLTFERKRLLTKLNDRLSLSLADIHFSTAGWRRQKDNLSQEEIISLQKHPSYLGRAESTSQVTSPAFDANATFQHWAKKVQERS
jgi:predicted nucleic acid-binding Zn ribbon protein